MLSEEGGEGGGGDVLGEAEDVLDLSARIESGHLSNLKRRVAFLYLLALHFTHQLVIVLIDELVTVCIRS